MSREVLLVGSVGLANAEDVFRAAATLGDRLARIPDGETGFARSVWIQCQIPFFLGNPQLEMVVPDPQRPGEFREASIPSGGIYSHSRSGYYQGRARFREGVNASDLQFSHVGYGDWAIESYSVFKGLKQEGIIGKATRFQVSIPSPRAILNSRVLPEALPVIEPAYEAALENDIRRIAAVVPAKELAIQWDCTEPTEWDRLASPVRDNAIARLVRIAGFVPDGVELGYHLCYGDFEHQHGRQPPDAGEMVEIANRVAAGVKRSIDWVHMPVPRDRSDNAYFAPLSGLKLAPQTRVFLGLVHYTDGADGARDRLAAARNVLPDFGIATECGFGRRPREQDIHELLRLHLRIAEL